MHECERSQCIVWVENCELLSGGNIWQLNFNEQFFRDKSGKVNTRDNKHRRQVQLAYFSSFFFFQPPGLIKLA